MNLGLVFIFPLAYDSESYILIRMNPVRPGGGAFCVRTKHRGTAIANQLQICRSGVAFIFVNTFLYSNIQMSKLLAVTPQCSMLALTPRRSNSVAELRPLHPQQSCRSAETTKNSLTPYDGNEGVQWKSGPDPYDGNEGFDPTVKISGLTPTEEISA